MTAALKDRILGFFRTKMGVDTAAISDQSPLFSTGLVDSFGMVELITFLEAEAGIRVNPMDVTMENIDSIERILGFVREKSGV
jgi:acyl carrier protein